MINWIREWSRSIVVAVIIATLIEMILPDNNSKKYIKIVVGIFIVYTIISPMISWLSSEKFDDIGYMENYIEVSSRSTINCEEFSSKNDASIRAIYSKNLQNDIISKLKGQGYVADYVNVKIAEDGSYNIEKIDVRITELINKNSGQKQARTVVDNIKTVIVKLDSQKEEQSIINENDKQTIKQFIEDNYGVEKDRILVFSS